MLAVIFLLAVVLIVVVLVGHLPLWLLFLLIVLAIFAFAARR